MCVCAHVQACIYVCGCLCFCVWKPKSMPDIFNSHSSYNFSRQGFSQNLEHIGLLGCQPAPATEQPSYTSPEQDYRHAQQHPRFHIDYGGPLSCLHAYAWSPLPRIFSSAQEATFLLWEMWTHFIIIALETKSRQSEAVDFTTRQSQARVGYWLRQRIKCVWTLQQASHSLPFPLAE